MMKRVLYLTIVMALLLLALAGCGSQQIPLANTIPIDTAPSETAPPGSWQDNILMHNSDIDAWRTSAFRMDVLRSEIRHITFLDTLAGMPEDAWDVSEDTNGSVMAWSEPEDGGLHLYIAGNGGVNARSCQYLFYFFNNLQTVELGTAFHTDEATSMASMFSYCENLKELDLSGLATSNVTDMSALFYDCSQLKNLILTGVDTKNVTTMEEMFVHCSQLSGLDLLSFDTGNVENMTDMFSGCNNLNALDLSSFDFSNVTDLPRLFNGIPNLDVVTLGDPNRAGVPAFLRDLLEGTLPDWYSNCLSTDQSDLPNSAFRTDIPRESVSAVTFLDTLTGMPEDAWDVSEDANGSVMAWAVPQGKFYHLYIAGEGGINGMNACYSLFCEYTNLKTIQFQRAFHTDYASNMSQMFCQCPSLAELDLSSLNTANVTNMASLFAGCTGLKSLDLTPLSTSKVTDMSHMFSGLTLSQLDVSSLNTSRVTEMNSMFSGCENLITLDLSGLDTSNVISMSYMFSHCPSLTVLDLSSFDTANVTDMSYMFISCPSLVDLNLSGFDTSSVTDMSRMFSLCPKLTVLDLSGFDTANVTTMHYMFSQCESLNTLDVASFNTSRVTDTSGMFAYCVNLENLDVSGFDMSQVTDISNMFDHCDQQYAYAPELGLSMLSQNINDWDLSAAVNRQHFLRADYPVGAVIHGIVFDGSDFF